MERRTRMGMQQMGMGDAQCCETSYELTRAGRGWEGMDKDEFKDKKTKEGRYVG